MSFLSDIRTIKSGDRELRSFGHVVGGVFFALGVFFLWKGKAHAPYFLWPGAALAILGFVAPRALRPVQKAWMALALAMGWVMTRVLLGALFYLILTPIGLITRMTGKDFMGTKGSPPSYWTPRPSRADMKRYEEQY